MRLAFARHGLQFFFLTICVEGRQAVLSRLVEGAKRPELTRAGRNNGKRKEKSWNN